MGQLAVPEEAASSLSTLASQRVAVCMVGAVRTLLLGAVHHSVKKNLLHAQLVPADLFLHLLGITRPMPATTVRVASRFRGPTSA